MSIEKIRNNKEFYSVRNLNDAKVVRNRAYLEMPRDSVNFTGNPTTTVKPLKDFLLGLMPSKIRWMVKVHEGMGEFQNQLINALGTGLVAPVFIKWNPLSKKDEDTRTYTAWRQPVSAVLAIGTQGAIVIPFNRLIQKLSDIGYLGEDYNASLFPSDRYVNNLVKEANPSYTKEQLKDAVDNYKKTREKAIIEMIEDDKLILNTHNGSKASTHQISDANFKSLFEETLDTIIDSEKTAKLDAIEKKLPNKIKRGILYHDNPDKSIELLNTIRDNLRTSYAEATTEKEGVSNVDCKQAKKIFEKKCKALIKELKKSAKKDITLKDLNEEFIKIIKEVRDKNTGTSPADLTIADNKISKMINSVTVMRTKGSTDEITQYVTEAVTKRTDSIDGVVDTLTKIKARLTDGNMSVKEAQAIVNDVIAESTKEAKRKYNAVGYTNVDFHESTEWIESTAARLSEKAKSIAKCILEQQKKHVKSNVDGMKRWTGLGVSLAMAPFTCWLLNKIYPWFMDLAFPTLSNKAASSKKADKEAEEVR